MGPVRRRKRQGGALFPVLILAGILLLLSSMLPQVLVSASRAMRVDRTREQLLYAVESGVAMYEARLKRRIGDDLLAGAEPNKPSATVYPTFDNPDFGKRKAIDFEVKLLGMKQKDIAYKTDQEIHRYSYALDARGWNQEGRRLRMSVNGLMTFVLKVDPGHGGMILRTLEDVTIEAVNREIQD